MVRNLSFKADDDFDDKLYSEARKRGITKSAFIKLELAKSMNNIEDKQTDVKNVNMVNESSEKKNISFNVNKDNDVVIESKNNVKTEKYEPIVSKPFEIKPLDGSNLVTSTSDKFITTMSSTNLNTITDKKLIDIKPIDTKPMENKRKVMTEENSGRYNSNVSPEEQYRKLRDKEKMQETMLHIHNRVEDMNDRICKDGECTKNELSTLKSEVLGLKDMRKEFERFNSLDKKLDKLDKLNELDTLKKDIDELKKNSDKIEVCPECGEKSVIHMSSFCSNCGSKIPEWTDSTGSKILNWKPYWEKHKV